jgi:putative PIN family toxin of toxin-antitoxin system
MKVVLDSNVLLVAIVKTNCYRPIWEAFVDGKFQLIVSDEVVYEYNEVIQNHSAPGAAEIIMEIFIESAYVTFKQVFYSWKFIAQDPDDNKFFDVAIAGNADYLVTNDAHFNVVKNLVFPFVKIVSADEFLAILDQTYHK